MSRSRKSLRTIAVAGSLVLLAACGGDDDDSDSTSAPEASGGGSALTVIAEDIDFGADSYEAEAGTVDFVYENEGSIVHTLLVEDVDGFKLEVNESGDVDEGSVELEAGEYVLYCDVPGHRSAGMEATLTVS